MTDEPDGHRPPPVHPDTGDGIPDVSVIIPTNRMSPYLGDALQSVVAQSFERWEIVVVDDGVPDPGSLDALAAGLEIRQQDEKAQVAGRQGRRDDAVEVEMP